MVPFCYPNTWSYNDDGTDGRKCDGISVSCLSVSPLGNSGSTISAVYPELH